MKIHEFQAKQLFRSYGIPVPDSHVAKSADEVAGLTERLGGKAVVKAQIHAGGRGKGTLINDSTINGVKVCQSATAAQAHAEALLGNALVTHQTGPEGQVVKQVLVEALGTIHTELYAALVLDRDNSRISFIASTEGGMDIEKVAEETPEKMVHVGIDPAAGLSSFHARRVAYGLGLKGKVAKKAAKLFSNLYKLCIEKDASLVEINPLVLTSADDDADVIALDGKMNFDENALYRHPELVEFRDVDEEDPKEREAKDNNLSYVSLDGNIGCLVNGAGLAMATMDIIKNVGGEPANFLDVGGSATAAQVTQAFKIILADPNVKGILINIFGGIAKCDVIADGVITAAKEVGLTLPLVVRLEGTNVDAGKKMLAESGLSIIPADDMLDAAQKVVSAASGGAA